MALASHHHRSILGENGAYVNAARSGTATVLICYNVRICLVSSGEALLKTAVAPPGQVESQKAVQVASRLFIYFVCPVSSAMDAVQSDAAREAVAQQKVPKKL
jgi:hypothetical protein